MATFQWLAWRIGEEHPHIALPALPSLQLSAEEKEELSKGLVIFGTVKTTPHCSALSNAHPDGRYDSNETDGSS